MSGFTMSILKLNKSCKLSTDFQIINTSLTRDIINDMKYNKYNKWLKLHFNEAIYINQWNVKLLKR